MGSQRSYCMPIWLQRRPSDVGIIHLNQLLNRCCRVSNTLPAEALEQRQQTSQHRVQSTIFASRQKSSYMSIISLNFRIPLPLSMPSTPSGIRYERTAGSLGGSFSDVSVTSTSPATFTDSIREGTMFYERLLARALLSSH